MLFQEVGPSLSKYFCIPQRAVLGIMGFLAVINAYTMRNCLAVAITEMVVRHNRSKNTSSAICKPTDLGGNIIKPGGTFTWSEQTIGIILSSFYWGYVITHLPGGMLADKFGGKYALSIGILSTAICTLLTPMVVHAGGGKPHYLIVLRVCMGFGEGTTFPALSALLADWIPLRERSFWGSLVLGGTQVGTILANSLSGMLIDKFGNWECVFYFFGICGVLWFISFTIFCYSTPKSHPCISAEERDYLEEQLGRLERSKTHPSPPWIHILTSAPVWALIIGQLGHDWGFYIMVSYLPKYMADVLLFPIKESGLYASLPYVVMWANSLGSALVSDYVIRNNIVGITLVRKTYTSIAAIGPGIFMVAASQAGCNRMLVVIFFTIAMTLMGFFYPSMKVNPIDLSPHYAGTLMAIVNGLGAIAGIVAPYVVGLLTPNASLDEWAIVFYVTLVVLVISAIVFMIWASGEIQPWDDPEAIKK